MTSTAIARWALSAAFAAAAALAVPAQEPEVPAEPDPTLEKDIEELEDAFGDRRQSRDAKATVVIRKLNERLKQPIHPKDQSTIAKTLVKVLTHGRLRPPDATTPYQAAADGLALLGDDGAEVLIKVYERKRFPQHTDWAPMREALIEAIGQTGSVRAVPFLVERVQRSGEDSELRAAGAAMARFESAPQQARKDMVEILARRLAGFEADASAPAVNPEQQLNMNRESAERTLRVVKGPWLAALTSLTGEQMETGGAWLQWFQDAKRKEWPDRTEKKDG